MGGRLGQWVGGGVAGHVGAAPTPLFWTFKIMGFGQKNRPTTPMFGIVGLEVFTIS